MTNITYTFKTVTHCDMCNAPSSAFRLLGRRLNQSQGFRPSAKIGISVSIVECKSCGLIFSTPTPIPQNIQDHYGVPPEDYWKGDYFRVDENYFTSEISKLKKLKQVKPGMRSLDVGAGLGKGMLALAKVGFETYGLEPSKSFYDRAISQMGIDSKRLQLNSIEDAFYENEFFDFISFSAVLEHFYEPSSAIRKVLPWLKKDGLIHIEVPNSKWLISKIINFVYRLKQDDYVGNISPMHSPYHLYEFSIESFRKNAVINNYSIINYHYYVCQTYMPRILDPLLKAYMERTNTGMQLVVWLGKAF